MQHLRSSFLFVCSVRDFSEPTGKSVKPWCRAVPCTVRKSRSRELGEERSICLADGVWYWQNSSSRVNTRTGLRVSKDQKGIAGIEGKRGWTGRRQREKGVWRDRATDRANGWSTLGKRIWYNRPELSSRARLDGRRSSRLGLRETVSYSGSSRRGEKTRISSRKIEGIRGDLSGIAYVRRASISVSC